MLLAVKRSSQTFCARSKSIQTWPNVCAAWASSILAKLLPSARSKLLFVFQAFTYAVIAKLIIGLCPVPSVFLEVYEETTCYVLTAPACPSMNLPCFPFLGILVCNAS